MHDDNRCERQLIDSDSYGPLCDLPAGHHPPCMSEHSQNIAIKLSGMCFYCREFRGITYHWLGASWVGACWRHRTAATIVENAYTDRLTSSAP